MLKYEIKKVLGRTGGRIALLLLAAVLAVTCWLAVSGLYYVNGKGESEYGLAAVRQLRAAKKEWAGTLDEDVIRRVIEENARINATPEGQSDDVDQNNIAYGWKQGFYDLRWIINCSFSDDFQSYSYYTIDGLSPDDAPDFYPNRVRKLRDWLESDESVRFSDAEKAYLIGRYEALDTPLPYDYYDGWEQLFEFAPTVMMLTVLILGYLNAGIFSNEFQWKSDAVFFSSRLGRSRAVRAKLAAGVALTTAVYWVMLLAYSAFVLLWLGADGAGCPIQMMIGGWKSFYSLSIWQEYLLVLAGGYIGCLFMSLMTMLVSAKARSAVVAAMVPFILIFLPAFLGELDSAWVSRLLGLLPDRLLQIHNAIRYFDLYEFGGAVVGALHLLYPLYIVLALALPPVIYRIYRRSQAG